MTLVALEHWLLSRPRREPCTTIVLHGTAGASGASSISWLRQIGLSYHYVIDRDGAITKCVPISRVAFHAGKSVGPNGPNVNDYSIGIAWANLENGQDPLTPKQMEAAKELIQTLARDDSGIRYLTRHKDISPGRKTDPIMLSTAKLLTLAESVKLTAWRPK